MPTAQTGRTHLIARMALFTALAVTFGLALMHLPNVELVTATVFIAGYTLGVKPGLAVGAVAEGLYSLFNPLGAPSPPLLAAQVLSMALAGAAGGILCRARVRSRWALAAAGAACTLTFAALTSTADGLALGFSGRRFAAYLMTGIWFYAVHLAGNTAVFFLLVPAVLGRISEKKNASQGERP